MPFDEGHKQSHGGARKGAGRKTSAIRELCAVEFAKRVPILCRIADEDKNRPSDRIAAIKELSRVGIPTIDPGYGEGGGIVVRVVYQDKALPEDDEGDAKALPAADTEGDEAAEA